MIGLNLVGWNLPERAVRDHHSYSCSFEAISSWLIVTLCDCLSISQDPTVNFSTAMDMRTISQPGPRESISECIKGKYFKFGYEVKRYSWSLMNFNAGLMQQSIFYIFSICFVLCPMHVACYFIDISAFLCAAEFWKGFWRGKCVN